MTSYTFVAKRIKRDKKWVSQKISQSLKNIIALVGNQNSMRADVTKMIKLIQKIGTELDEISRSQSIHSPLFDDIEKSNLEHYQKFKQKQTEHLMTKEKQEQEVIRRLGHTLNDILSQQYSIDREFGVLITLYEMMDNILQMDFATGYILNLPTYLQKSKIPNKDIPLTLTAARRSEFKALIHRLNEEREIHKRYIMRTTEFVRLFNDIIPVQNSLKSQEVLDLARLVVLFYDTIAVKDTTVGVLKQWLLDLWDGDGASTAISYRRFITSAFRQNDIQSHYFTVNDMKPIVFSKAPVIRTRRSDKDKPADTYSVVEDKNCKPVEKVYVSDTSEQPAITSPVCLVQELKTIEKKDYRLFAYTEITDELSPLDTFALTVQNGRVEYFREYLPRYFTAKYAQCPPLPTLPCSYFHKKKIQQHHGNTLITRTLPSPHGIRGVH